MVKNALASLLLGIFFIGATFAERIELDIHDKSKVWIEVTCIYNEDYNDFWVFGCPVSLDGDDDEYPSRKGFWTPCSAQRCEIHYFGGAGVPQARSLTLSMYLKGSPEILVGSKYSPLDEECSEVGKITKDNGNGWFETTIDLADQNGRALLLNFTLTSSTDDVLLLDKIILDLGEDVTTPTEPPPITTSMPIVDDIVTLENDSDYWLLWDVDCNFVDEYEDLWVYGCPENPQERQDVTNGGYWAPCKAKSAIPHCRLQYLGNYEDSAVGKEAFSIRIFGYMDGDALINVTLQNDPKDVNCNECHILRIISNDEDTNGKWISPSISLNDFSSEKVLINLDIYTGVGGQALIDKIEVFLKERGNPSTTTAPPTEKTNTPTGNTGNPTGSTGNTNVPTGSTENTNVPTGTSTDNSNIPTGNPTGTGLTETTTTALASKNELKLFFILIPLTLLLLKAT